MSSSLALSHNIPTRSGAAQMDEPEGRRLKASEDSGSQAEPDVPKVSDYQQLQNDLKSDAQNLEAESWSLAVDQNYLISLNKEAIERQDAIYELIQTEMHHVRTLKTLVHIYMYELKQSLLIDEAGMDRLFPGVEVLLGLHQIFLNCLKMRQKESMEEGSSKNYYIQQLGDILIAQFSGSLGEQMMGAYSYFCSHHTEAVSFYKDQIQTKKKLQALIKKIDQASLVRRLGIPECFLLVTQRITKYPFLVERIIKNTEANMDEYRSLVKGLELIRETISQVNIQVREYEKVYRLREISHRLEPKTQAHMKDGRVFRREDLIQGNRSLLYEGTLTWKSSGKLKEVVAVLLSDVLVLLQEKDQKLVFASMDYKSPVISLQRVIVREVAHEDTGLYLICACTRGQAEMYEIYTGSREERQALMTLIREAVENYEEKEQYNKLITGLQRYQDMLQQRDELIKHYLAEKQQIFDALYKEVIGQEAPHKGLLLRGETADLQQGEALLAGAIEDVEILQNLFFMRIKGPNHHTENEMQAVGIRRTQTFAGIDSNTNVKYGDAADTPDRSVGFSSYSRQTSCENLLKRLSISEGLEQSVREADADDETGVHLLPHCSSISSHFPDKAVCDRVLKLSKKLHSLEAVIVQQDSMIELQKAFHAKSKLPTRSYSNVLLEQEKQRALKKQKEETADLQKQWAQHRDEQQRWEKERKTLEAALKQREEECRRREEKLDEENSELTRQWESYQEDLKSLRETVQKVEKDKERLKKEKEKLKSRNYDDPTWSYSTLRGSVVNGAGTLPAPPNTRAPGRVLSDSTDIPPRVPPRRESISPRPISQNRPVVRVSTALHTQRPAAVQQIPRELATTSRRREKSMKGKRAHKRAHSAANIDVSQVVPIRVAGKEGGSLKTMRNNSPQRSLNPDTFRPPAPAPNVKPSPFNTNRRDGSEEPPPLPPPFPKDIKKNEDKLVIV
ncbi:rho guanine nucleotide exchange factor 18a [Austrofundulus limnaeus]|uniref:Rho guanine nucleotide exchange factor 18a n=1 Tax=Austrofundulus limnaeus TaxID=52670 RepID=A0A2I4B556_AUSLI|nr:PREDICTED: rho guanine nucleotide exchange factor 18-like [Austrofundulus limnaeus]